MATRSGRRRADSSPAPTLPGHASAWFPERDRSLVRTGCYWAAAGLALCYALLRGGAAESTDTTGRDRAAAAVLQIQVTSPSTPSEPTHAVWCPLPLGAAAGQSVSLPAIPAGEKLSVIVLAFGSPREQTRVELLQQTPVNAVAATPSPWRAVDIASARRSVPAITHAEAPPLTRPEISTPAAEARAQKHTEPLQTQRVETDGSEVTLTEIWSGRGCRVWLAAAEATQPPLLDWCAQLGAFVDEQILPRVWQDQGLWPDVDGDGCVNLVVSHSVGQIAPGLRAFVRKQDFQSQRASGQPPWDAIHIQPGVPFEELEPILIHELTHVAEFSWCQHLLPDGAWPIPDWLTEGLAHAAELRLSDRWENTLPRLQTFAGNSGTCPLRVVDASHSGLWRDPGHRGASAAFCAWWTQSHQPIHWPRLILAFRESEAPWQMLSGTQFTELYEKWALSMATQGVPTGPLGPCIPLQRKMLQRDRPLNLVLTGTAFSVVELDRGTAQHSTSLRVQQSEGLARVQLLLLRQPAADY